MYEPFPRFRFLTNLNLQNGVASSTWRSRDEKYNRQAGSVCCQVPTSEPVFVKLLRSPGIYSQPVGINSLESTPGLLKLLKRVLIWAQLFLLFFYGLIFRAGIGSSVCNKSRCSRRIRICIDRSDLARLDPDARTQLWNRQKLNFLLTFKLCCTYGKARIRIWIRIYFGIKLLDPDPYRNHCGYAIVQCGLQFSFPLKK